MKDFYEADPYELLNCADDDDLISWNYVCDFETPFKGRDYQIVLNCKYYPFSQGATYYEYRVLCEEFSNVTGAQIRHESYWEHKLSPFKEWLFANRVLIYQATRNSDFVQDIINDSDFPDNSPKEMLQGG
jgi:hypothetical protein